MFDFGGISVTLTKKQIIAESSKMVLEDRYISNSPDKYVVFLVDRQPNALQFKRLQELIFKAGMC